MGRNDDKRTQRGASLSLLGNGGMNYGRSKKRFAVAAGNGGMNYGRSKGASLLLLGARHELTDAARRFAVAEGNGDWGNVYPGSLRTVRNLIKDFL